MTKPTPPYLFKNNFQEVLSGEFRPKQDVFRRAWSLQQLAHLAVTEGRCETEYTHINVEKNRINFFYEPSWASNVEADIFGDFYDGIAIIDSFIYDEKIDEDYGAELIVNLYHGSTVNVNDTDYEVSTAKGMLVARDAVAQAAQEFFDGIQSAL